MNKILNIATGISTIGNTLDVNQDIEALNNTNLESVKTLLDGNWKSWTKGADAAFQGFTDLASGRGYIVNSYGDTTIELTGNTLDINDLTVIPGLQMLAFSDDRNSIIGDGFISRMKIGSIKTIDGNWKSWTAGAADDFQGFTGIDGTNGYVCNVEEVFNSVINAISKDNSEGVSFRLPDSSLNNEEIDSGVTYTDPNSLGSISFNSVTYDATVPTLIMFLSIDGVISKLDFPVELLNSTFYIDTATARYTGSFVENEDYANPTILTEIDTSDNIEMTYDPKTFDSSVEPKTMKLIYDGIVGEIDYAVEYEGDSFKVWYKGNVYDNIFTEGTVEVAII